MTQDTPNPASTGNVADFDKKRVEAENKQELETPKKDQTPIEQYWTKFLLRSGEYAVSYDDNENPILWRWHRIKRTWDTVNKAKLRKDVSSFLSREKPARYSDKSINSCVNVTETYIMSHGREMELNQDFVISTKSHFLEVLKDGTIKAHDKDELGGAAKKFFVRCHIDIDLNKTAKERVGNNYILPSNNSIEQKESLLAKMIKLGFPKLDNRRCAQEFMGDTLNPAKRKAFPVLVGEPDGGKSQFLTLLMGIHERSTSIDLERIDTFDSQKILGKSFVAVDEIGKRISEKHFKRMIGGARFDVQRKGIENLSIRSDFKVMAADNEVFGFSEKTGAMETRIFLIKVEPVKESERVDDIAEKIIADEQERQDLLDWLLIGAVSVVKRGRLLRHDEMPQDSKDKMERMTNKQNPCVDFLLESGAKFNDKHLTPKIDVFRNFLLYCEETNRGVIRRVGFETWCRDYFASAVKQVCPDYKPEFERRAYTTIEGQRKRVVCFPLEFTNMPEYVGKYITTMEAYKTFNDKEAYDEKNLPKHILDKILKEAEELQKTADLTDEQKKIYTERKMKQEGFTQDKNGAWFKGDGNIQL